MNPKYNTMFDKSPPPYPPELVCGTPEREPEIINILNQLDRELSYLNESSHMFIDRIRSVMGSMAENPNCGEAGFPIQTPLGQRLMSVVQQVESIRRRLYDARCAVEL